MIAGRERDVLVFRSPNGGPLRFGNFRQRVWYPAVKAAGLEGLTPHGLRHAAASLYISAGTPPKVVQCILGHASVTMTMDLTATYTRTRWTAGRRTWMRLLGDQCGQNVASRAATARMSRRLRPVQGCDLREHECPQRGM